MVVAVGTCFARAISRSYFKASGSPTGPIAAIFPISLSFNMNLPHAHSRPRRSVMMLSPAPAEPTRSPPGLEPWSLPRPGRTRRRLAACACCPRRKRAACAHDLLDEVECLAPYLAIVGKHRRKRGERSFCVEHKDRELLAHERFEGG